MLTGTIDSSTVIRMPHGAEHALKNLIESINELKNKVATLENKLE